MVLWKEEKEERKKKEEEDKLCIKPLQIAELQRFVITTSGMVYHFLEKICRHHHCPEHC